MITFILLTTHILAAAGNMIPIGPSEIGSSKEQVLTKPSFEYTLISNHIFQSTLELNDRSSWVIAPPDAYKAVSWEPNDIVILTPNFSWFSIYKHQFFMTNFTSNSYVRVNLVSHPADYKKESRWIISIDKFGNRLFLNDGSSWKIYPDDAALFQDWGLNDFIMYGKNDQRPAQFPFLLINTRLNHHVRAVEF